MPSNFESIEEAIRGIKTIQVVSCPLVPMAIPGITAADALDAGDCMGTVFTIKVPKRGRIISATLLDLDDEGLQIDLELYKRSIPSIGNDTAWAPADANQLNFITELPFWAFDDHINNQTSELLNIGKAYTAPEGRLWIQAVARGASNIAAGSEPRVQIQIESYDPDFVEE